MRQTLIEVLIVAVPAGVLGTIAAWSAQDALAALSRDQIPRVAGISMNLRVLAFAAFATLTSAVASAVIPALLAGRTPAMSSLRDRSPAASPGVMRLLRGLIVAQVALGFVVAVCAMLLGRSVDRLLRADRGFDGDRRGRCAPDSAGDGLDAVRRRPG